MSSKKEKKAEPSEDDKLRARVEFVNGLAETEAFQDSPINLDICNTTPIILPNLAWFNYELPPKKMKITNTGHTVILSAKWYEERPFLANGPLQSVYVFNQMHFHWGPSDCDGSEHLVENKTYPLEMHIVHFKSSYATQDIALREKDGMVVLIYFFQIQDQDNPSMKTLVEGLPYISPPHTSVQISPFSMTDMVPTFAGDYLVYWGCVNAVACKHRVMWVISREKMGISCSQLEQFRSLMSTAGEPLPKHFRRVATSPRTVFHVNGGATSTATTLLPVRAGPLVHISQPGPGYRKGGQKKKLQPPVLDKPEPIFKQPQSQSIPVFAVENNHFKMPYHRNQELVQNCQVAEEEVVIPPCKSVSFNRKQMDFLSAEEERRVLEESLIREREERQQRTRMQEWKRQQQEQQEMEETSYPEEEGQRGNGSQMDEQMDEQQWQVQLVEEQIRKLNLQKQELDEKRRQIQAMDEERRLLEGEDKGEMDQYRRQLQAQWERVRQQENERRMSEERHRYEERQRQEQPWEDDDQIEMFHAATQKPSIGFKLRKPLVHVKRKLDMATQVPSFTAMYRPANALSTQTIYVGSEHAVGLGRNESGFVGGELSLGPSEVMTYSVSFKKSKPKVKQASYAMNEDCDNDDYSALSCFDTKDFHVTPKGSIAPTASVRRAQQEMQVYNMGVLHEDDQFTIDRTTSNTN